MKNMTSDQDDIKSIPETACETKWRMISVLSYVVILFGFGIPIWWHTTKVYRANLPLNEMLELKSQPPVPQRVLIYTASTQKSKILVNELQSLLGGTVNASVFTGNINFLTLENEKSIDEAAKNMKIDAGVLLLAEMPDLKKDIVLTSGRVLFFRVGISSYQLAMVLEKWPGVDLKTALTDPKDRANRENFLPFPAAPKYDILVTVVHPEPQHLDVEWDIVQAIDEYLKPYLNKLSKIVKFSVKSQWLYLASLGEEPKYIGDHWALPEPLLPRIITPLEKKLSSHVSKDPCINLVIYIPPCGKSPIHIYTKEGVRSSGPTDAFISPRWGGVQISNPNCSLKVFTPNTDLVMATLITQLSQLIGLPSIKSYDIVQLGSEPADWQLDFLIRMRTLEYLDSSRLTLRSLAQLLSEISNIVINDDVAQSVWSAVSNIAYAEQYLSDGKMFEGFQAAELSALSAEAAFTDPTLLALLYFPDDQKYAVYIPLFLPIMIPVIMSLGQLLKFYKNLNKEK